VREIADLVVRGNKGAMRGLELLGWERNVDSVEEAFELLRNVLNTQLSTVQILERGDEAERTRATEATKTGSVYRLFFKMYMFLVVRSNLGSFRSSRCYFQLRSVP